MTLFLAGSAALIFLLALGGALIYSGHIRWVCSVTGAAQPEAEPRPSDFERSVALGLIETPDAYADRIASVHAALTEADAAAGHLDTTIPAQTRKETP